MKALYFNILHKIAGIIAISIGYIYAPFSRKHIHFTEVEIAQKLLQPGDAIVIRTHGELSTLVVPGFWKHLAIYTGAGKIVDATHVGVSERHLADLMMDTDNVAILRIHGLTDFEKYYICRYVKSMIGTPYDFEVNIETKTKVFCSELFYLAANYAKQQEYFDLRESMGIPTLTPQDVYDARKKVDLIWEKKA